jgi:hypothetical protein
MLLEKKKKHYNRKQATFIVISKLSGPVDVTSLSYSSKLAAF